MVRAQTERKEIYDGVKKVLIHISVASLLFQKWYEIS